MHESEAICMPVNSSLLSFNIFELHINFLCNAFHNWVINYTNRVTMGDKLVMMVYSLGSTARHGRLNALNDKKVNG